MTIKGIWKLNEWWSTHKMYLLKMMIKSLFIDMRKYPHYIKGGKKATKYAERGLIFVLLFCFRWYIHRKESGRINTKMFSSVQFSCSVVSDSLQPHGLQHTRPPCSSPTPRVYSNSCPLSQWCHPTISSSVIPFSSRLQSLPASGSFPMSQFFPSGGQSIGASASASVLPMNIQDWFPLGLTG